MIYHHILIFDTFVVLPLQAAASCFPRWKLLLSLQMIAAANSAAPTLGLGGFRIAAASLGVGAHTAIKTHKAVRNYLL